MIDIHTPADLNKLRGMSISLTHMIEFVMAEYGLDREQAEQKARSEAEKVGVKLIEDGGGHD